MKTKQITIISIGAYAGKSSKQLEREREEMLVNREEWLKDLPRLSRARRPRVKKESIITLPVHKEVKYYVVNPFTKKRIYIHLDELNRWKAGGADIKEEVL